MPQSHVISADSWYFRHPAEIWSLHMAGLYEEPIRRNVIRVAGAGDRTTGQAYLDQLDLQITTSLSEEERTSLYLLFGFLDRHFQRILATEPSAATRHLAGIHLWRGNLFRRTGFTAHPKYLKLVKSLGIDTVWEHRGPPDFCNKVENNWVCE